MSSIVVGDEMERVVTSSVRTLVFCISTAAIKTRIHFFPTASTGGGHHAVSCQLTLFGKGVETRSIVLDGGRVNQPDGLRLEDAFPALRGDLSGVFGLEIQLASPQGRVNLMGSQSAVEFVSPQFSMLYGGAPFAPMKSEDQGLGGTSIAASLQEPRKRALSAVAMQDSFLTSSLVIINAGKESLRPEMMRRGGEAAKPLHVGTISPESVIEMPLEEALFKESAPHECLWGASYAEKISLSESARSEDSSYYLLYRDPATKRPVSVCSI